MTESPLGEEREVRSFGGIAVDGAPVAYIISLAGVVTVLAFIPLSVVLGGGSSFPMSQGVYPLVGWILGPVAGALSSSIGALVGALVAPYTTSVIWVTITSAIVGSFTAGAMVDGGPRRHWWIPLAALFTLSYLLYAGRAVVQNGVELLPALLGSFIDWSALLLFILPTRTLAARWIGSSDMRRVATGLFLGTWIAAGLSHLTASTVMYFIINWPNPVWMMMAPMAPVEHAVRSLIGAVVGSGVIAGMRAAGLVKPRWAMY